MPAPFALRIRYGTLSVHAGLAQGRPKEGGPVLPYADETGFLRVSSYIFYKKTALKNAASFARSLSADFSVLRMD